MFSILPRDIKDYIFSFLDDRSLIRAERTCRQWYELIESSNTWKERLGVETKPLTNRSWKECLTIYKGYKFQGKYTKELISKQPLYQSFVQSTIEGSHLIHSGSYYADGKSCNFLQADWQLLCMWPIDPKYYPKTPIQQAWALSETTFVTLQNNECIIRPVEDQQIKMNRQIHYIENAPNWFTSVALFGDKIYLGTFTDAKKHNYGEALILSTSGDFIDTLHFPLYEDFPEVTADLTVNFLFVDEHAIMGVVTGTQAQKPRMGIPTSVFVLLNPNSPKSSPQIIKPATAIVSMAKWDQKRIYHLDKEASTIHTYARNTGELLNSFTFSDPEEKSLIKDFSVQGEIFCIATGKSLYLIDSSFRRRLNVLGLDTNPITSVDLKDKTIHAVTTSSEWNTDNNRSQSIYTIKWS